MLDLLSHSLSALSSRSFQHPSGILIMRGWSILSEKEYRTDQAGVYYVVPARSAENPGPGAASEPTSEPCTIARLWNEYQRANPKLKGMSVYRAIYNAHLRGPFGEKEPSAITAFELDRLRLEGMRGRSPKTIANAFELLRRIINFGVKRGLCEGPRFTIELPRVNNEKTEDLTPAELRRLVAVLDRHLGPTGKEVAAPASSCTDGTAAFPYIDGAAMMKLVLYTGMRRGELFRLKWSDLDFHRGNIRLREPKGGRDAVIPMSSFARALLERWRADLESGSLRTQKRTHKRTIAENPSDFVFPGKDGGQRRDIRAQVNAIKAEAGLPADFRPLHGLRHVFASGLISSGAEFQLVQRLLTHKGGTVTHRYAHIRDDALREAAELAGCLVEEAAE